jgi:hypothetical protein
MHLRITQVEVPAPRQLALTFADGSRGTIDLTPWPEGRRGLFAALQDPAFFAQVRVDPEAGTVVWPNGADWDPDVLYEAAHGAGVAPSSGRGGV